MAAEEKMTSEWIKRYTHAVARQLPERQREDIERELSGLITEKIDDRLQGRVATDADIKAVLTEMGDPRRLADRYRGRPRTLIGPELYPTYLTILTITLGAVAIAMLVAFIVQTVVTPGGVIDHLLAGLANLFNAAAQAFAWVTVSFALAERFGDAKQLSAAAVGSDWTPADLPELPERSLYIGRGEPIASIVFTAVFTALVTVALNIFGIWVFDSGRGGQVVSFLNADVFRTYLPFIWALAALSIVNEILKLATGRWTARLIAFDLFVDACNFALALFIFSNPAIWNPEFVDQAVRAGLVPREGGTFNTLATLWRQATSSVIYVVGLAFGIGLIQSVVRAVRLRGSPSRP